MRVNLKKLQLSVDQIRVNEGWIILLKVEHDFFYFNKEWMKGESQGEIRLLF